MSEATAGLGRKVVALEEALALATSEAEAGAAAAASLRDLEASLVKVHAERSSAEQKLATSTRAAAEVQARADAAEAAASRASIEAAVTVAAAEAKSREDGVAIEALERRCTLLEAEVALLAGRPSPEEVGALRKRVVLLERLQYGDEDADEGGGGLGEAKLVLSAPSNELTNPDGVELVDWVVEHSARLQKAIAQERRQKSEARKEAAAAVADLESSRKDAERLEQELNTARQVSRLLCLENCDIFSVLTSRPRFFIRL